MPFVEELWNNTTSPYKNWHKKIKWFIIFIKPNKCQKNRKETEMEKTYLCLPAAQLLCWPSSVRPSWTSPPASSSSWRQSARRVAGARARPCRHATCLPVLPLVAWMPRATPRAAPHLSRSLPCPFPLPLALSRARPNATVAAARCCRSHRLPLDLSPRPRAPPRRLLRPRRARQLGTHRIAASAVIFNSGRRGSPPPVRRLQSLPRAAVASAGLPVSSHLESPSPLCLLQAAATIPPEAELRPPPRAPLRRAPPPPQPLAGSPGCAGARATSWCPQPPLPWLPAGTPPWPVVAGDEPRRLSPATWVRPGR